MFSAPTYVIREATDRDAHALQQLADVSGQKPLEGTVLVGEIAGRPAAAISLEDDRIVADAFGLALGLSAQLRTRAHAFRTYEILPSFRQRILNGVHPGAGADAAWN
ncbi:MAG TPA: hypothetical protein VGF74_16345 [Thermoleophilaceae bacterium]